MNQSQSQTLTVGQSIQMCLMVLTDVKNLLSKDPKTIPQEQYFKVLEGMKLINQFMLDIFHIIKNHQESQKIVITKEILK